MFSKTKNWRSKDVTQLRQICRKNIKSNHPPPRAIIQGQINLEHFIYHNEVLKDKIKTLQNETNSCIKQQQLFINLEKEYKICQRKLKNRDLQLKQFRKRIVNLESLNKDIKIELNLSKEQITNIQNESNSKVQNYIDEIKDLKDIIKNLEPNELSSYASDEQDLSESNHYHRLREETRSQSSLPNTQDREFRVSDDDTDMEDESDSFRPSPESSGDDTEESSQIS